MAISSRTPEGVPNVCPVCGSAVTVEPSVPMGDAPCPACGTLLWFVSVSGQTVYFSPDDPKTLQYRAVEAAAHAIGLPLHEALADPEFLRKLGLDSLDAVELILEQEDNDASND
jgi:acyl carrier protein